jgi:SAM-dependent methyltransferase
MKSTADVAANFNAIAAALADSSAAERLSPAEHWLLRAIPAGARTGLDVGCGDGVLTRAAAGRGPAMLGLDLSPRMIALARSRTAPGVAARFQVADIMSADLDPGAFDVVISVNMLHHVPLAAAVPRLATLVAPGGRLLVQDVLARPGLRYLPLNLAAGAWRHVRRLGGSDRLPGAVRRLYARHGAGERYLTPPAAVEAYGTLLPGARLTHHLAWRYSVVWTRPRAE